MLAACTLHTHPHLASPHTLSSSPHTHPLASSHVHVHVPSPPCHRYGFNPGSTLLIHSVSKDAARAAVTTTLSACSGAVVGLFVKRLLPASLGGSPGVWDLGHTCNSLLGGLVGITAGTSVASPAGAVIIGAISAFVYHLASCTMRKLKIGDPLDAFAVHGACGLWGVWAVGLFAHASYSYAPAAGSAARLGADGVTDLGVDAGILMPGARGTLFLMQLITPLIEIAWVTTTSGILFSILKAAKIFRVSADQETVGMDVSKHGGDAVRIATPTHPCRTPRTPHFALPCALCHTASCSATSHAIPMNPDPAVHQHGWNVRHIGRQGCHRYQVRLNHPGAWKRSPVRLMVTVVHEGYPQFRLLHRFGHERKADEEHNLSCTLAV